MIDRAKLLKLFAQDIRKMSHIQVVDRLNDRITDRKILCTAAVTCFSLTTI